MVKILTKQNPIEKTANDTINVVSAETSYVHYLIYYNVGYILVSHDKTDGF